MIEIGRLNSLRVLRFAAPGAYLGPLDDDNEQEVLLPGKQVAADCRVGDVLTVFVHHDSEDRPVATTTTPLAQLGEVAWLKVVAVNDAGAFLDWGLPKDLLLPYNEIPREQKEFLEPGRFIMVMVFQDDQRRIAASARLDDFLAKEADGFAEGEQVDLLIADRTDLGQRVVVNHRYWGLVHNNEIFGTLRKGERRAGWIKTLRSDHRLNLALTAPGPGKIDAAAQGILDKIISHGGFMAVTDKSPPEAIYKLFGVSKKVFKQGIGSLYKNRLITIENAGLRTVDNSRQSS